MLSVGNWGPLVAESGSPLLLCSRWSVWQGDMAKGKFGFHLKPFVDFPIAADFVMAPSPCCSAAGALLS